MNLEDFIDTIPPDTFVALCISIDARRRREATPKELDTGDPEAGIPPALTEPEILGPGAGSWASLAEVERAHILEILRIVKGNRSEAAKVLKIGERTLFRKLEEYGVARKRKKKEIGDERSG